MYKPLGLTGLAVLAFMAVGCGSATLATSPASHTTSTPALPPGCTDAGCVSNATSPPTPIPTAAPTAAPTAVPTPTPCNVLACEMTGASGVQGVPLPSDAAAKDPGARNFGWTSHLANITAFTSFYQNYMQNAGWTYEPSSSQLDPQQNANQGGAYETIQDWCQSGSPVKDVSIQVGSSTNQDQGDNVEIFLVDSTGQYTSCP
jgi:hypothetical protein